MLRESLQGVRVLDFSHVVAGPVCGMLLGDLGADVIKIEPPSGEPGRMIGPPWQNGQSVTAMSVNRNKRGLAIDLKSPGALDVVRRLVGQSDILLESFRPGVMQRLGLSYEHARALNPRLIYCSVSAYGQSGPNRDRPGVDGIIQAVTGLMSTLGEESGTPCKVSVPIADMATGYLATVAVLGALHKLARSGEGQHLDVSLYNSTLMFQQIGYAFYLATGDEPRKLGSAAPYAAPNEAFPTSDGWIMVAAYQPERWRRLCKLLGLERIIEDVRFASNHARVVNRDLLTELLGEAFQQRRTSEWLPLLEAADILCAPIATYREVTQSLHYQQAGVEISTEHPLAGEFRMPGFAIGKDLAPHRSAPLLGEHSFSVLKDFGFGEEEIGSLCAAGIVTGHSGESRVAS
jgi:crotonobetainyl-CoA:carnitine CoA-transferase CaiB-like acyl-CoA transferase